MPTDVIEVIVGPPPVIEIVTGMPGPIGATGPQGEQGEQGDPGPVGPQGPAGADASGDVVGPAGATANAVAVFDGATGKIVKDAVGAAAFGTINALAVGVNPAQSGAIRLANNQELKGRTAANDGDRSVARVNSDDTVVVGDPATALILAGAASILANDTYVGGNLLPNADAVRTLGRADVRFATAHVATSVNVGANPAQSGAIRLPNDGTITARNAANTADLPVVRLAADNTVQVGDQAGIPATYLRATGPVYVMPGAATFTFSATAFFPDVDGTLVLGHAGARFQYAHVSDSVRVGTNPAQTGAIRLANNQAVTARNAGNTADLPVVKVNAEDAITVGAGSGSLNLDAAHVYLNGVLHCYYPGTLELAENAAPAAPGATIGVVYMDNNGAGKSRLMIRFATGAPVQIAIQP